VMISPGFFGILGLPIVSGRDFSPQDGANASQVALVSQSFAAQRWPEGQAIGQRIDLDVLSRSVEVIGVVPDADPAASIVGRSVVYLPSGQHYSPRMLLLVQGHDETALRERIQEAARLADSTIPAMDITPLRERWSVEMRSARLSARLLGAFAACGLVLTLTGIYGLSSYLISSRARELRIRRALGASSADIYRLVLNELVGIIGRGLTLGLLFGELFAWLIKRALLGVSPLDGPTLLTVSVVVVGVAAGTCFLATRRTGTENSLGILRNL
jgi:putative ABC transport system permease protein